MANKDSTKHPRAKNFELSPREITIVQNWEALLGLAPKLTAVVEGCALSTIYTRLATGEYQALKDGPRTKITTESIKARRANLRRAEYKPLQLRTSHPVAAE